MKIITGILFLFFSMFAEAQTINVTVSGLVRDGSTKKGLPFVTVGLKNPHSGNETRTITNEEGRFSFSGTAPGDYRLQLSYSGFQSVSTTVLVGKLSSFLDLGSFELYPDSAFLKQVVITATQDQISDKMEKKTFSITNNITQSGGSVLQAMRNLPGITINDEGKVELRGSDKVTLLVDGKQTALTGFGNQSALDNIPASAIDRIEIINNPNARYDANGNAGIINIIYKKSRQEGWTGKIGIVTGLGALWEKQENLPTIRPQYKATPKINPSVSLNYQKNKLNAFAQGDWLYNKTLNKNDFTTRYYANGDTISNQVKRNRITTTWLAKAGLDWYADDYNAFSVSGLFSHEYIRDNGDIPYFDKKNNERQRLWQFYEDEVLTASTLNTSYQYKFKQPGHVLNIGFNYTFHREDEKYFLTDIRPTYTGRDTFMLIADQHVADFNLDYVRPLKQGRLEAGMKFRRRNIPTNMEFFPGINSPLDTNAAGWAEYSETIPAIYGNYVYESNRLEVEAGMRFEYVRLEYDVNPDHNTYSSDGYDYTQPFPSLRLAYKFNENNKLSVFYNRRVDRPDEGDIRIFPKYDDPEILKVGNPALQPQFTNTVELSYRKTISKGYLYAALYHRMTDGTISRIGTKIPNSTIIYSVFQNAGKSNNSGVEVIFQQNFSKVFSLNTNLNLYRNYFNAFTVVNQYPVPTIYVATAQTAHSGSFKVNSLFHFSNGIDIQLSGIYQAPDIIPQGKVHSRYSVDAGLKKSIQKGKGELIVNATDIFNTLRTKKEITGTDFKYKSTDYYETQVFRVGYNYKF